MDRVNCFEVQGPDIIPGISLKRNSGNSKLPSMGDFSQKNERNSDAVGQSIQGGKVVFHATSRPTNIFYFEVGKLNFGGTPFCFGLNVWPGGEEQNGCNLLWKNDTTRGKADRCELWSVRCGERLILVDRFGGIRFLESEEGAPKLYEPYPSDVKNYFDRKHVQFIAQADDANKHRRMKWVIENLGLLDRTFQGER